MDARIKVATPLVGQEEVDAVAQVLRSGQYMSGPVVAELENRFAAWCGVAHAVAVNSGTAALHAALMAARVGPGDEVIVPPLTFFSTVTAVIHQGGVPIFADIDLDNFCLSPEAVAARITPRTKAVLPVHYFGQMADMDALNALAERNGLVVIEDCAQAHGSLYRGTKAGALGHLGAFSFFATKNMTTGEGGMITTNNADWADAMRCFRSHGMVGRDDHVMLGYNYRMTEIAAAMGLVQLAKLDAMNTARIRACETLSDHLRDIDWLTLPIIPAHVRHSYFWLHIMVDEEKLGFSTAELIQRLDTRGIETRRRYTRPLNHQPLLTRAVPPILRLSAGANLPDYGAEHYPNAARAAGHVIGLPNRPDLSETEIARISHALHTIREG